MADDYGRAPPLLRCFGVILSYNTATRLIQGCTSTQCDAWLDHCSYGQLCKTCEYVQCTTESVNWMATRASISLKARREYPKSYLRIARGVIAAGSKVIHKFIHKLSH